MSNDTKMEGVQDGSVAKLKSKEEEEVEAVTLSSSSTEVEDINNLKHKQSLGQTNTGPTELQAEASCYEQSSVKSGSFSVEDALKLCCKEEKPELLKKLSLNNLKIEKFEDGFFVKFPVLEDLDVRSNQLSSLDVSESCVNLKVLNCSHNSLKSVEELLLFPNLENVSIAGNNDIQVSERYKLVSCLSKLKILDGKDISSMKEAVHRLDSMLAGKLVELFRSKEIKKMKHDWESVNNYPELEKTVIEMAQTTIICGPEVLKDYREYRLESLVKKQLLEYLAGRLKSPPGSPGNGDMETDKPIGKRVRSRMEPVASDTCSVLNKKMKNVDVQVDNINGDDSSYKYTLSYLLQTHSLNNDPKDWETKVWMCEFQPDATSPGNTTTICATCGGDSVCFIDCDTGTVVMRFKQLKEVFYCLAWTVIDMIDEAKGELRKSSMLAVAGLHGDIKLIIPEQLICYQEVSHHRRPIDALLFHPLHPSWLFSGSEDRTIVLWDIGNPFTPTLDVKAKKLLILKASNIVRQIAAIPHGKTLIGSCDDGCYAWNIDNFSESQTRPPKYKFIFPGDKRLPVDSVSCISDNVLATKRIEEGKIDLWYSKSAFEENDAIITHYLPWRMTETPFLKFNYIESGKLLLAGDDEGLIWLYDIIKCKMNDDIQSGNGKERRAPITLPHMKCLRCTNPLAKLLNHVTTSGTMNYIVAVSDTNVVAVWKKTL